MSVWQDGRSSLMNNHKYVHTEPYMWHHHTPHKIRTHLTSTKHICKDSKILDPLFFESYAISREELATMATWISLSMNNLWWWVYSSRPQATGAPLTTNLQFFKIFKRAKEKHLKNNELIVRQDYPWARLIV